MQKKKKGESKTQRHKKKWENVLPKRKRSRAAEDKTTEEKI